MNPWRDVIIIRDHDHWSDRYDRWYDRCDRPSRIVHRRPIKWEHPLPDVDTWTYLDIQTVAINMEGITREIYEVMSQVTPSNPNREYAERLMRVLGDLAWASETFTDAVYNGYDYTESLNELFYLESQVDLTEWTLDGYSKAYLVDEEMRTMRYLVNELMWRYRQNY